MKTDDALTDEASSFSARLAETLEGVLGAAHEVRVTVVDGRVSVRPADLDGIPLQAEVDEEVFLRLKFKFSCTWDGHRKFLAVQDSEFHVLSEWDDDPLFRYEFVKEPTGDIPVAHVQIHAHRDATAYAMGYPGSGSRRARRRLKGSDKIPHLSNLHFPLGGARFRPALEDILEMLIEEFGVQATEGWRRVVGDGREDWRILQLKSAVRDDLESAAQVLRDNGYDVRFEGSTRPGRGQGLRKY